MEGESHKSKYNKHIWFRACSVSVGGADVASHSDVESNNLRGSMLFKKKTPL